MSLSPFSTFLVYQYKGTPEMVIQSFAHSLPVLLCWKNSFSCKKFQNMNNRREISTLQRRWSSHENAIFHQCYPHENRLFLNDTSINRPIEMICLASYCDDCFVLGKPFYCFLIHSLFWVFMFYLFRDIFKNVWHIKMNLILFSVTIFAIYDYFH